MQGRLITFKALRPILETSFKCRIEFFPEGTGHDADGTPSPALYAFFRDIGSGQVLLSTMVVHHDGLPIFETHLRSFLARLKLTIEDVIEHL